MSIKRQIQNNIINPADQDRRGFLSTAEIIESDEKNNVCSIRYIDKDGNVSNKKNVPLRVYNTSMIDWFPKKNEKVVIQDTGNGRLIIISKECTDYSSKVRADNELKSDILSNTYSDFMGGYIF